MFQLHTELRTCMCSCAWLAAFYITAVSSLLFLQIWTFLPILHVWIYAYKFLNILWTLWCNFYSDWTFIFEDIELFHTSNMEIFTLSVAISSLLGVVFRSIPNIPQAVFHNKHITQPLDAVVCFRECHQPPIRYTSAWLHTKSSECAHPTVCLLTELSLAGIDRQPVLYTSKKAKTTRGKRAGRRKQRHISVRAGSNIIPPANVSTPANVKNYEPPPTWAYLRRIHVSLN